MDTLIHNYVSKQKRLLELELRAEEEEDEIIEQKERNRKKNVIKKDHDNDINEETKRANRIIRNLQVEEWSIGLMGRTVVSLVPIKGEISHGSENDNNDKEVDGKQQDDGESQDESETKKVKSRQKHKSDKVIILPAHRITVGDEVEIISKNHYNNDMTTNNRKNNRRRSFGGVVSAVTETMISIALYGNKNNVNRSSSSSEKDEQDQSDETQILGSPPLTIVPKSSIEVHKKMIQVLHRLESEGVNHPFAGKVILGVFEPATLQPNDQNHNGDGKESTFTSFNPNLDQSQIDAIKFCLEDRPISLIHGPPGTGKTTTVAELINQAVFNHNLRVLVTAPSNVAIDNVLERLVLSIKCHDDVNLKRKKSKRGIDRSATNIRAVRLGHPARIQSSILKYSLEALVQNSDETEIVTDIRSELQSYLQVLSNPKSKGVEKRTAYREMKLLRKEIREREEKVVHSLIANAQVVLATNVGAASSLLDKYEKSPMSKPFDIVIIDEAAQALECSCWIPILRGKRIVLAGDHCQLPPTIKSSNKEVQRELSITMFERIMKQNQVSKMLQIQYRMHEDIANWASNAMYQGQLISHDTVKSRKLYNLPHIVQLQNESSTPDSKNHLISMTREATLLLIDTAGSEMFESTNAAGSRYNEGEAVLVERHVRFLIKVGLKQEEIAVITPYNGQVEILKKLLLIDFPKLEIRSVDGFQGGEREAVVLSLVRSSTRKGGNAIGFLKDNRRLNVAVTRAKRQCAIICDSDTVSQDHFLKSLVNWIEEKGEYISSIEYDQNEYHQHKSASDFTDLYDKLYVNEMPLSNIEIESCEKPQELRVLPKKEKMITSTSPKDPKHIDLRIQKIINQEEIQQPHKKKDIPTSPIHDNMCTLQDKNYAYKTHEEPIPINSVLNKLAQEREARIKVQNQPLHKKINKKKATTVGQKLGGSKIKCTKTKGDDLSLLDDMAFLDAQIKKVQTSHGRSIDATGKNYRTIVNGVLLSKPSPKEKKKDSYAANALHAKIKQAQSSRKSKAKKKK